MPGEDRNLHVRRQIHFFPVIFNCHPVQVDAALYYRLVSGLKKCSKRKIKKHVSVRLNSNVTVRSQSARSFGMSFFVFCFFWFLLLLLLILLLLLCLSGLTSAPLGSKPGLVHAGVTVVCVRVCDAQSIRVDAVEHDALHVHLHVLCKGKQISIYTPEKIGVLI